MVIKCESLIKRSTKELDFAAVSVFCCRYFDVPPWKISTPQELQPSVTYQQGVLSSRRGAGAKMEVEKPEGWNWWNNCGYYIICDRWSYWIILMYWCSMLDSCVLQWECICYVFVVFLLWNILEWFLREELAINVFLVTSIIYYYILYMYTSDLDVFDFGMVLSFVKKAANPSLYTVNHCYFRSDTQSQ